MKHAGLLLLIAAGLGLSGCATHRGYYYAAPPALIVQNRYGAPRPGMVWIDGYWGAGPRNHIWVPGRRVVPPRGRAWVAPRWEQRNGRYQFRGGRWR